jgi:hypothetical protein
MKRIYGIWSTALTVTICTFSPTLMASDPTEKMKTKAAALLEETISAATRYRIESAMELNKEITVLIATLTREVVEGFRAFNISHFSGNILVARNAIAESIATINTINDLITQYTHPSFATRIFNKKNVIRSKLQIIIENKIGQHKKQLELAVTILSQTVTLASDSIKRVDPKQINNMVQALLNLLFATENALLIAENSARTMVLS